MYHGNGDASKQQHTTGGTWRTGYKVVNHLYDDDLMIQQLTIIKMITIHFT